MYKDEDYIKTNLESNLQHYRNSLDLRTYYIKTNLESNLQRFFKNVVNAAYYIKTNLESNLQPGVDGLKIGTELYQNQFGKQSTTL